MENVELKLAALIQKVDSGFDHINLRMDEAATRNVDRHEENVTRLERMEEKLDVTNGRVSKLEGVSQSHESRFGRQHQLLDDFRRELQGLRDYVKTEIRKVLGLPTSLHSFVTLILIVIGACVAGTFWFVMNVMRQP